MREMWVIAKRELLERVRSKWFVAMTLLGPILMVGLVLGPALLAGSGGKNAKVQIVDQTGKVGAILATDLATDPDAHWHTEVVPPTTSDDELLARVRHEEINGFVRIPPDGLGKGTIVYRGDNATNQLVEITLQKNITLAVYAGRGVPLDELVPPKIEKLHTNGETSGSSGAGMFLIGYIIAFILYMVITLYGINVMRSVVTEKSSRVVELLVASAKPRSLMAGKVLGVGGAGLAQVGLWFVVGGIALAYRTTILGWFGASGAGSSLPTLSAVQVAVIVVYFVLGYLFYSTMYAAIGATVSNEQDSQQAQTPITMFLIIGMVSMTAITGDPRGGSAQLLTMVPFWSPMLMPLRYLLGGATTAELATSLAILVVSTYVVTLAAAKIFRIGILMYGKRPSLRELGRWLRY